MRWLSRLERFPQKALVLADQVLVSGVGFATNLLLARALGLTDYGRFSGLLLGLLVGQSLQQAGLTGLYQVRWPALSRGYQPRYTTALLYGQAVWLGLLLAGLGLGLLVAALVCPVWWTTYLTGYAATLPALTLALPTLLGQDFLRRVLLTQRRAGAVLCLDAGACVSQLLLLALSWRTGWLTLPGAWWIIGATSLPTVIVGVVWLAPGPWRSGDMGRLRRQHTRLGRWLVLSALLQWSAGNYFLLAAGWWLGAAALGALRLGQYVFGLLNVGLQAAESYALPRASAVAAQPDALRRYLWRVGLGLAGLVAPLLLALAVGGETLLTLTGGEAYRPYAYVMTGLAGLYVLVVAGYPVRMALRVRLQNKAYFIGYVLATLFSLSAAPALIGRLGLTGVLLGLAGAQALLLAYWVWVLSSHRTTQWTLFTSFSARPIRPE